MTESPPASASLSIDEKLKARDLKKLLGEGAAHLESGLQTHAREALLADLYLEIGELDVTPGTETIEPFQLEGGCEVHPTLV
jgi:hypothetical protein